MYRALAKAIMTGHVFRRGVMRPLRATVRGNWHGTVQRIVRSSPLMGTPPPVGYTFSRLGVLVPLRERFAWSNIIVNVGLDYMLDAALSGGTPVTSWYVVPTTGSDTFAAADTMASHAGWTEWTAYSEATRQAWTDGGVSARSVDNVGNEATFTANADTQTVGGAGLCSSSTKSETASTLFAGAPFGSDKSLDTSETIAIGATFTIADDGA